MIAIAWICAVISGVADPSMIIFFGKSVNDFATAGKFVACENDKTALEEGNILDVSDYCKLTLATLNDHEKEFLENSTDSESYNVGLSKPMGDNIMWFIILGCVVWVTGFVQTACLMLSSENQINRLRKKSERFKKKTILESKNDFLLYDFIFSIFKTELLIFPPLCVKISVISTHKIPASSTRECSKM